MPHIVIIDKSGSVKSTNWKEFDEQNLYKKAGFKSADGFAPRCVWGEDQGLDCIICLYGKTRGKAGHENKYDFPPPVDSLLLFGTCVLVARDLETSEVISLKTEDWEDIYETLFGGFEDIEDTDDEDDDESDVVAAPKTANGYVKDGFVVDDDECESESTSSENEAKPIPPPKPEPTIVVARPKKTTAPTPTPTPAPELYAYEGEQELTEEDYV